MTVVSVADSELDQVRTILKRGLVAAGFAETLTTPFVAEAAARRSFQAAREPVLIENAMRKDENALRQSLLDSLLTVRRINQDNGNDEGIRVFEITVVYLKREDAGIPEHRSILGGLLDGVFADARGALDQLASSLGISDLVFEPIGSEHAELLESDGAARILIGGEAAGYVGTPTTKLRKEIGLKSSPVFFEIRLDRLSAAAKLTPSYRPFSRFPAAHRDLAVVVDEARSWGEIEAIVRALELPNLEGLQFFDEFRNEKLGAGKKSLAFSLTYRSHERTLTSEDVEEAQQRAISALERELGARLRDV